MSNPASRVGIAGVASFLPDRVVGNEEVARRITEASAGAVRPSADAIRRATGVVTRRYAADGVQSSDLAVGAARRLLSDRRVPVDEVDLLVFGSASQDLIEPATSHIVATKLGARCPVLDVKNACNSWLNGIQIAEALVRAGQYARVLVCCGELTTRGIQWRVTDRNDLAHAFPAFTLSDAGVAALVEPVSTGGFFYRTFTAHSQSWSAVTVLGGGTMHPHDPAYTYFRGSGHQLKKAFRALGADPLDRALDQTGLSWEDFAVICVHAASVPHLNELCERVGIPQKRLVPTLPAYGNIASATLPLQLSLALAEGRCGPGDRVALVGLASGVSLGVMFLELSE